MEAASSAVAAAQLAVDVINTIKSADADFLIFILHLPFACAPMVIWRCFSVPSIEEIVMVSRLRHQPTTDLP